MAREKSEARLKAKQLYLDSGKTMKLVDIAAKLNLPDVRIRKWKCEDDWDGNKDTKGRESKKKQKERSTKNEKERSFKNNKDSLPKPSGGQRGNKNATGGPVGNKKALKHGGYSAIYWDTLDDEEKELIESMPTEEETLLEDQIRLFSIRERRLLKAIAIYRNETKENPKGIKGVSLIGALRMESKRDFGGDKELEVKYNQLVEEKQNEKYISYYGHEYGLHTSTESNIRIIESLERELSNVQTRKTKAIADLAKLRLEKQKADMSSTGKEIVNEWVTALMETEAGYE